MLSSKNSENFENIFSELKIDVTRSFGGLVFANTSNCIVEKDSEIKIVCFRGSGGDFLFFLAKTGVSPKTISTVFASDFC